MFEFFLETQKIQGRFRIFILMSILSGIILNIQAQQVVVSEGGQNIQIFTKDLYYIIAGNEDTKNDSFGIKKPTPHWLNEINIIEAEYFVQVFTNQKEIDALNLDLKHARKTNNIVEEKKGKENLQDLRSKQKDLESLYSNALSYKKLADNLYKKGATGQSKKLDKLTNYIQSKDYMFKSISYRGKQKPEMVLKTSPPEETKAIQTEKNQNVGSVAENKISPVSLESSDCSMLSEQRFGYVEYKHGFTPMFHYTPDRLISLLKDEDLVLGDSRIRYDKKSYHLDFRIILRSKDAAKSYGFIPEGNLVRLEFVNGLRLNLKVKELVIGRLEEYSGRVIYDLTFLLDKEMIKQLESMPLDNMGVMWSTGYEKYTIYEIDTFMRQILCFKSIIN
jgi:hypothetical protein